MDTIFALSSGSPPAGIAIVRVSGPCAADALRLLMGTLPKPRRARFGSFHSSDGALLDQGLALWFPGPGSATGEDLAEFHLHGGRAVVAAIETALEVLPGLRRAQPGEFTRRAFANGRIDLAEAEGLADLLAAESELQRRAALVTAGGGLSRKIAQWCDRILAISAEIEAALDFDDEDDVRVPEASVGQAIDELRREIEEQLSAPRAETLREGFRVVLAGPPNAGKSTLFNALIESEAAITAAQAGTTRDVLVRPVAIGGVPFSFVDTAGLRTDSDDEVEAIGIARARAELERADLVLWLGPEGHGPDRAWEIDAQIDRVGHSPKVAPRNSLSALTGAGMAELKQSLVDEAMTAMPGPGEAALDSRQRHLIADAAAALAAAQDLDDLLLVAEQLRAARSAFERLTGRASTEDMLDALFGRFCIGK